MRENEIWPSAWAVRNAWQHYWSKCLMKGQSRLALAPLGNDVANAIVTQFLKSQKKEK